MNDRVTTRRSISNPGTIMSTEGRLFLESTLGGLLGFDDGASDVLDHLLTIESREVRPHFQEICLLSQP